MIEAKLAERLVDLILPLIRSHTNALVVGAYEACAKHGHTFLNGDCLEQCVCGHILGPKHMTWEQIQDAQRQHIRSLTPADAAQELERRLQEAQLEEGKWWQEYMDVNRGYRSAPNDLGSMRIADLSQPKETSGEPDWDAIKKHELDLEPRSNHD